jgi:hypothetical protein
MNSDCPRNTRNTRKVLIAVVMLGLCSCVHMDDSGVTAFGGKGPTMGGTSPASGTMKTPFAAVRPSLGSLLELSEAFVPMPLRLGLPTRRATTPRN